MEKYIVKYKSKVNGNYIETFHVSISETNPNLKTMNAYTENISTLKQDARIFYDRQEAEKVINFFENIFHIGKVIKK